jgi:hypothetical protein
MEWAMIGTAEGVDAKTNQIAVSSLLGGGPASWLYDLPVRMTCRSGGGAVEERREGERGWSFPDHRASAMLLSLWNLCDSRSQMPLRGFQSNLLMGTRCQDDSVDWRLKSGGWHASPSPLCK